MNRDLNKSLKKMFDANQLDFNVDKTNSIHFHSSQKIIEEHTVIKFMKKYLT